MLFSYLKTALRVLSRYRAYVVLNVAGLTVGLTGGVLIFLLLRFHLHFDRHHPAFDRTYRVVTDLVYPNQTQRSPGVPFPVAGALRQDLRQAEAIALVRGFDAQVTPVDSIRRAERRFQETGTLAYADPAWFAVFGYSLRAGTPPTEALREPGRVVLTERLARKYFDTPEAVGRLLRLDNRVTLTVTTVLEDLPLTTDLRHEAFVSLGTLQSLQPDLLTDWRSVNNRTQCFVVLPPGYSAERADALLAAEFVPKYYGPDARRYRHHLQSLADLHFNGAYDGTDFRPMLWALALVGGLLVGASCLNFINLATSQATRRAREIGVRKTLGGQRVDLFGQFMTETALVVLGAVGLAVGLSYALLPYFNDVFQSRLSFGLVSDRVLGLFVVGLVVLVTVGAGTYPALVLSGLSPVRALSGRLGGRAGRGLNLRKILVVSQLFVTQLLLFGALTVERQSRFLREAALGFQPDRVLLLPLPPARSTTVRALTNELRRLPGVERVSASLSPPVGGVSNTVPFRLGDKPAEEGFQAGLRFADPDYLATYGLRLVAGRNLAPGDSVHEFLANQTFARQLDAAHPERLLSQTVEAAGVRGAVVGIVADFHTQSLQSPIAPCLLTTGPESYQSLGLRLRDGDPAPLLAAVRPVWERAFPNDVFRYEFLSERVRQFYAVEDILLRVIRFFAGLAVLIGGVGLYGLVAFVSEQRSKEIGLRKVMGASDGAIRWLLAREFAEHVLLAAALALPLGWWAMGAWLDLYAYRIGLGAGLALGVLALTLLTVALTVGYRIQRAARTNPVDVLRLG